MNSNFKLDISYIAGLFDAKGIVSHRNKVWKMEISMADKNVMELVHETLECGELRKIKKQWRWKCLGKDCFFMAKLLWSYTTVKLHKIEQIIDHYEPDIQDVDDNLVDLALERQKRYGLKND
jgi:hypothetical protein|tara:strand:+ start:638 stop:1003 length:366 start_codon:yes stop_codon:yes gene_type:complete